MIYVYVMYELFYLVANLYYLGQNFIKNREEAVFFSQNCIF